MYKDILNMRDYNLRLINICKIFHSIVITFLLNVLNFFNKPNIFIFFSFIFLFNITNSLIAQDIPQENNIRIEITIIDKVGNEPLNDTEVIIIESGKRYKTNFLGKIVANVSKFGVYHLRILGLDKIDKRTIDIRFNNQKFNLFASSESQGIEVKGQKDKSNLSSYNLSQQEIKRLPGSQGDSLKAIQTLPGILPAVPVGLTPTPQFNVNITGQPYRNSDRGDFVLRGAGPRANQTYLDGLPVSYPFHLGGQSSVFNNNIISDLEILTGAYSVKYGFATGGILNVTSKTYVPKRVSVINLNTFLTDAYIESPLWEGAYMLAGARKSYPNLFLLRAYPQGIPQDAKYADYQDYQWKLSTKLPMDQTIQLYSFAARDIQGYSRTQAEFESNSGGRDNRPPIGLDRGFITNGISHEWKFGDRIKHTIRASKNTFKEYYELKFTSPATAETVFGLNNTTNQDLFFVENSLLIQIFQPLSLDVGGNYRERRIGLKAENISSQSTLFADVFNDLLKSSPTFRALIDGDGILTKEQAGFGELKFSANNFLIIAGARYDEYNRSRDRKISPRGSISYKFESTGTTIQGGTGIFRNAPIGIEQFSLKSGNPNLGMETAEHSVVGINQELGSKWIFKLEGYKNVYRDIVVSDSYIQDPFALNNNPRDYLESPQSVRDNPIQARGLSYSNRGYGYSDGFEIFIRKNPDTSRSSGWFGWFSYSQSITKRNNNQPRISDDDNTQRVKNNFGKKLRYQSELQEGYVNVYDDNSYEFLFNNDKAEMYDLDRTHILSAVFGWKINPDWQLGGRFRYATGLPVTQINGSSRVDQVATFGLNLFLPKYSDLYNSYRLPSIHQLDIRLDRFFNYSWGYMNWYVDLINVYGRRNPTEENYDNTKPFTNGNPGYNYDTLNSPYIQSGLSGGRLVYLPMINFGIEVRF
jgi:hypothetical protein